MAVLNFDEQARVDRVAELEAKQRAGTWVPDSELEEARTIADNMRRQAEIREQRRVERNAADEAKRAANQARLDAVAQTAADAFLREARLRYPGTEDDWSRDKDEILRQWRIRNAVGSDTPRGWY